MLEITAALSSVGQLVGLAKTAIDARDDVKARQALSDITSRLHDATMSALASAEKAAALQQQVGALQGELRDLQKKLEDRERYTLAEIRPGGYAYAGKPREEGDDPEPPYLCQPCYDKGVKAVLQFQQARVGMLAHYTCPEGGQPHMVAIPGTALPDSGPRTISRGFRPDW